MMRDLFSPRRVHLLNATYRSTKKPAMPLAMRCPLQIIGCSALATGTEGGSVEFVFGRSDVDDEGPNRCCTSILQLAAKGDPTESSCETAVRSCIGANGLDIRR